jgi:hypothetical protein
MERSTLMGSRNLLIVDGPSQRKISANAQVRSNASITVNISLVVLLLGAAVSSASRWSSLVLRTRICAIIKGH